MYLDSRYKPLLVIGESHYMPKGSTVQLDPDRWYKGNENHLDEDERAWIHTRDVIKANFIEPHKVRGIFRNIGHEIYTVMKDSGLRPHKLLHIFLLIGL